MASVGMRCPGDVRLLVQGSRTTFHPDGRRGAVSLISSRRRRSMLSNDKNITMLAMSSSSSTEEKTKKNYYRTLQKAVPSSKYKSIKDDDKADEWMKESVVEIVRNLREAPLLVHLYTSRPEQTKLESGVEEEDWAVQSENWEKGAAPLPDGVIFVEQLQGQGQGPDEEEEEDRAWGVVVQGRGLDCGPVCYLLKTSSGCAGGLGLCCTHFCLMRVHNFWDTARSQLTNCWLLP